MKKIAAILFAALALGGCMTSQEKLERQQIRLCYEAGYDFQKYEVEDDKLVIMCVNRKDGSMVYFDLIKEKNLRQMDY